MEVGGLLCSLTGELPVDPVMTEDGVIYERESIEEYFDQTTDESEVLSPNTGKLIGKNLVPVPTSNTHIEFLVDNGQIDAVLVKKWKLKTLALGGDVDAMAKLANNYYHGNKDDDYDQNNYEAYKWSKKAHLGGNLTGTTILGLSLLKGGNDDGSGHIPKKTTNAVMYLAWAAHGGCNLSAYKLGSALMGPSNTYGLDMDKDEAKRLLRLSLHEDGNRVAMSKYCKDWAVSHLKKMKAEEE